MNDIIYNRIKAQADLLEHIVVHGYSPDGSNNSIRTFVGIYKEIHPEAPPVDFGCPACIADVCRILYNKFKNYKPATEKITYVGTKHEKNTSRKS